MERGTPRRRRRELVLPSLIAMLLTLGLGACEAEDPSPVEQERSSSDDSADGGLPQGDDPFDLDPADFSTTIDNPYWPMEPGTRWTYREIDEEGKEVKVVVVVTTETKEIANGVTVVVVRDVVTEDDELIEDTKDWYAQDADGNVWYMGEDTAEFEEGKISTKEGSWEAGVDGALPGIIMPARPEAGLRYRQELYPGHAEDNGEVLSMNEMATVPFGFFDDALLIKDTSTIEPRVLEYKLYARGVGPVLVLGVSGGGGREELVRVDTAPPSAGIGPLGSPNV